MLPFTLFPLASLAPAYMKVRWIECLCPPNLQAEALPSYGVACGDRPVEVIRVDEINRVGPCDEISAQVRRGGHTT